jgi:VWFA-related protein
MFIGQRFGLLLFAPLLYAAAVSAQPPAATAAPPVDSKIHLDVVVTPKSGSPISGLQEQDFTVLDNKTPQPITSFHAVTGNQAPIEAILVIDAINTDYQHVANERVQVDKFLRDNGGHLPVPVALAIVGDTGTQIQEGFSTDGNALSADLEKYSVAFRNITRATGFWGAEDRFNLSLRALRELTAREASRPGRKFILWVSPGWPLLSGPGVDLDSKQERQLFAMIVDISSELRLAHTTLYSVDPLGTQDAATFRTFYYEEFLKGVTEPRKVLPGNLALQVIAAQSGGLVLNSDNDVSALLRRCVADTTAYYEISFAPPLDTQPDEYHQVEVKVAKSGVTARTRQGYYSQAAPQ